MPTPPRLRKDCGARDGAIKMFFMHASARELERGYFLTDAFTMDARAQPPKAGTSASTTTDLAVAAAKEDASKCWRRARRSAEGRGRDSRKRQDARRRCLCSPVGTRVQSRAKSWDGLTRREIGLQRKSCWKPLNCSPFGWETSWTCWNPTS